MNANLILAIERDFQTLAHISKNADGLAKDGDPMPDGQGTVMARFNSAVLEFMPAYEAMLRAVDPVAADELDRIIEETPALKNPPAPVGLEEAAKKIAEDLIMPEGNFACAGKGSSAEVLKIGDFHLYDDRSHILLFCPGDTNPTLLPLQPSDPHGWVLSEHVLGITLTPSIFRDAPHGWHGWMTDGVLSTVPSAGRVLGTSAPAVDTSGLFKPSIEPAPQKPKKFWQAGMGPMPREDEQ